MSFLDLKSTLNLIIKCKEIYYKTGGIIMTKSKVYFTDFRTKLGEGLPTK